MKAGWICLALAAPIFSGALHAQAPAPAALSVPNPLAGLRSGGQDLFQSPDGGDRFQQLERRHDLYPHAPRPRIRHRFVPLFGGPWADPAAPRGFADDIAPRHPRGVRDPWPEGRLSIEAFPDSAEVYVDGFYMGLAEDFGLRGRPLPLRTGPHRVELRADGFQDATFAVRISTGETLRYRSDLRRLATPLAPERTDLSTRAAERAAPRTLYVIPNCYAGDRPPPDTLPARCDRRHLRTVR